MTVARFESRIQELERERSSLGSPFTPPPGVLLALGSAHFRNGDRAEAEQEWAEATRLNPRLGEAWNNLAVIYLQSDRKREASDAVSRAERAGFRVNPRLKDDIKRMPGRPGTRGLPLQVTQSVVCRRPAIAFIPADRGNPSRNRGTLGCGAGWRAS